MANELHRFTWDRGDTVDSVAVTTETGTAAGDVVVDIKRATTSLEKQDVINALNMVVQRLLAADSWPPDVIS